MPAPPGEKGQRANPLLPPHPVRRAIHVWRPPRCAKVRRPNVNGLLRIQETRRPRYYGRHKVHVAFQKKRLFVFKGKAIECKLGTICKMEKFPQVLRSFFVCCIEISGFSWWQQVAEEQPVESGGLHLVLLFWNFETLGSQLNAAPVASWEIRKRVSCPGFSIRSCDEPFPQKENAV